MKHLLQAIAKAICLILITILVTALIIVIIQKAFSPTDPEAIFSEEVGGSLEWSTGGVWAPEDLPLDVTFNLVFPGEADPVRVMRIDSGQGRNTSDRNFNTGWMAALHGMFLEAYRSDPTRTAAWLDRWSVTLYDSAGCELEAGR